MKYLIPVLIMALLLVSACNAPQENNDNTNTQENNDETTEQQATTKPTEKLDSGESITDEIESFLTKKANLEFMVKYDMSTNAGGQVTTGKMTQYMKNTNQYRVDFEGQGVESRTFMNGNTFTSCTNQDEWTCLEITYEPSESDNIQAEFEENLPSYDQASLGTRTIAGTSANCYKVEQEQSYVEWCFSSDGVPLYIKTEAQGYVSELTATDYSTSVPANAFDLPAEPQSLEDMMNNLPDMGDFNY